MNQKKAKAIRRAMRAEIQKGSDYKWVAHPEIYINVRGEKMLKYKFQYIVQGGLRLVKLGKKIYNMSKVLPREQHA